MTQPWVYREQPPPHALATFVRALWSEAVGERTDHPGARVLPDGCADVVWKRGRPPFIAGPATAPIVTSDPNGTLIVGIRFQTGAASSVLGVPAHELRDAEVPLADVWGREVCEQLAYAEGSDSPAERLSALQALVVSRLADDPTPDDLARQAVRWLARHPNDRLDALHETTGLSERQLRRRFEAAVGYGPKTFQRIVRFRQWLQLAQATPPEQRVLVDLAADAGYADQAHLTREVTRLAGLPPAALLATFEPRQGPTPCPPPHCGGEGEPFGSCERTPPLPRTGEGVGGEGFMSVSFKTGPIRVGTIEHMSENDLRALPDVGPEIART